MIRGYDTGGGGRNTYSYKKGNARNPVGPKGEGEESLGKKGSEQVPLMGGKGGERVLHKKNQESSHLGGGRKKKKKFLPPLFLRKLENKDLGEEKELIF